MDERGDSAALGRELIAQARRRLFVYPALLDKVEEIEDFARRGEDLSSRMHHEVLTSRMRPLADSLRGLPGWCVTSPARWARASSPGDGREHWR